MGVEGVFICSSEGRLVYYRCYGSIPHTLFEDFAYALPSSLQSDSQRCFVSHGGHRLVFLPLESLYVVMVTPRNSNIIEDVETIGNIKEVIHSILAPNLNEEAVQENFQDLTFAFDDMISMGTRNAFSRTQIQALLEMESSNEKLQQAILLNKEKEAQKKAAAESKKIERSLKVNEILSKEFKEIDESIKKIAGSDSPGVKPSASYTAPVEYSTNPEKMSAKGVKGLQLKPAKGKETGLSFPGAQKKATERVEETREANSFNPLSEELELGLEERLSGQLSSSGDWKSLELKGVLRLTIFNPKLTKFQIELGNKKPEPQLNIRLPPSFDKKRWAEGVLTVREGAALPSVDQPTETLKYGASLTSSPFQPPFKLTTWPGTNDFAAEIEFNPSQTLFPSIDSLTIEFKVPEKLGASIRDYSGSEAINIKGGFRWTIVNLGPDNPSATFEIEAKKELNPDDLFPADIEIASSRTCLDLGQLTAKGADDLPIKFKFEAHLASKELRIE